MHGREYLLERRIVPIARWFAWGNVVIEFERNIVFWRYGVIRLAHAVVFEMIVWRFAMFWFRSRRRMRALWW